MEFPILVRGHFKHTVEKFDIETLEIIIKGTWSYIYIYIVTVLKLYMTGRWQLVLLH